MTVFSKEWFELHQKPILRFANTRFGRWILRIHKALPSKERIVQMGPSHYTVYLGPKDGRERWRSDFRSHPKFAKRLYYAFRPLWWMFHGWDMGFANNFKPEWNLGFDTTGNLFPTAGAVDPCDGTVARESVDEDFATIRAGAGTSSSATVGSGGGDTTDVRMQGSTTNDQFQRIDRNIYNFDTSVIGADKGVDTAVFSVEGTAKFNALGADNFHVCGATPNGTNTVIDSDYGQLASTAFGSVVYASFSTAAYNDITLNSNGEANVAMEGKTSYGTRLGWDLNNSFGGTWASNSTTALRSFMADRAGTGNDPKLVVTFSASGPANVSSYLGVAIANIDTVDATDKANITSIDSVA